MAKQTLPINFVDDILAQPMGGKRKFTITDNGDGTYSIEDVTEYTQIGSDFGASQINQTNQAVNDSCDKADVIDDYDDVIANKSPGKIAGALALAYLSSKLAVVKFTIANTSYVNMPAQNCYYEPLTGKVHIEAAFLNSGGNIPGQTALATVPSLYRPLATLDFPAMFNNSCGSAAIDTNGVLRQYASHVQQYMYICTDYFI